MNDLAEEQEQELSDRFNLGERTSTDPTEDRVLHSYQFAKDHLTDYALPQPDLASLSRLMKQEISGRKEVVHSRLFHWGDVLKPAFVSACAVAVVVVFGVFLLSPRYVTTAHFRAQSDSTEQSLPFLWKHRLDRGRFVTVPDAICAEIRLTDGSVVSCEPGTQLAVEMGQTRHISINAGEISIQAAHVENSELTVGTPLGTVRVVGTMFRVRVIR